MKEAVLQLVKDGFDVRFKDGGFTLKDSLSITVSKNYHGVPMARCHILTGVEYDYIPQILEDIREELDRNGENAGS